MATNQNPHITDPDMRAMLRLPPLTGWVPYSQPGQSDTEGFSGWRNMETGELTTNDPNTDPSRSSSYYGGAAEERLRQASVNQNGEGGGSGGMFGLIQSQQKADISDIQPFLEQALDPSVVAKGIELKPYLEGVQIHPHGTSTQQGIDANIQAANTVLSRIKAEHPDWFRRDAPWGEWQPWSNFQDWSARQNSRGGGFSGGLFNGAIGDIVKVALGTAGFGVGGTTGAAIATGNAESVEDLGDYLLLDVAGLAAGAGISGMMASGAAMPAASFSAAEEASMLGAAGGEGTGALAGIDAGAASAAETIGGTPTNAQRFLVADSGQAMTDVGPGLLEGAQAAGGAETGAFDMYGAATSPGSEVTIFDGLPNSRGIIGGAMDFAKENPLLTVGALQVGGGVIAGAANAANQRELQEQRIAADRELAERRVQQEKELAEWKRRFTQQGSYFDANIPVRPRSKVLLRPDGTPVYGPSGLVARSMNG